MDRYNLDEIKSSASGQWKSIIESIGGLSRGQIDGNHHPCPKCGGNDRFRMIDDKTGALFCNHCFSTKNGDGIAAIMWLLDCDFKTALLNIGQHLGLNPEKKSRTKDPAKDLKFVDWNDLLAAGWCLKKKPITVDALKKAGARQAIYRDQHKVIAIPVWRKSPDNIVGWCIYNITGGTLPKFKPDRTVEQVKVKLTYGSTAGLMGFIDPDSSTIYKTEGPTDMLALAPVVSSGASVICNANGAKENPIKSFQWLPDLLDGKEIRVVHDADQPGQDGATMVKDRPGWASWLALKCENSVVKNLILPYDIQPTHGKDVRDWLSDGNGIDDLETLAEVDPINGAEVESPIDVHEADDDPHRLARVNLQHYKSNFGGRLVFHADRWWKYKAGRYQQIENGELNAKVSKLVRREFIQKWKEETDPEGPVKKVTVGLVRNVIAAMASMCSIPSSVKMPCWLPDRKRRNYLSMANGMLDLDAVFDGQEDVLKEHSSDWFSSFRLNYKWDIDALCPKWEQYLEQSMESDQDRIDLLQEWAGYLLTNQNDHQKFLVLEGEGKNGKTVFFAGMIAMLGEENVSHVAMENFGGNFSLGATLGKAANISGDVGEIDQLAEGILKQFTGGDTMQFDRKNIQPIQARPTAKLMAAWNQRPRIKDRSDGLWRRLLLVPFRRQVSESERIYGMDQPKYWIDQGEAPGILLWALCGLERLKSNKKFTQCQVSADALADYQIDSNPASEFLSEYIEENPEGSIETKQLFDMYVHWCKNVNCRPLGSRQFGKELRRRYPLVDRVKVKRDRKISWHYKKISFASKEIFAKATDDGEMFG